MKNAYRFFALLCMGFAALACVEENFENDQPRYDTTPGNEIVFTATAGIENGMPKTKTEYGDKDETKHLIEINWVDGDKISIVSPQAAGAEVAHYEVSADSQTDGNYDGPHSASQLTRLGDAGLQWTAEDKYDFYAVYPTVRESNSASLIKEGVFTGTMPREQTFKSLDNAKDENGKDGKIAVPNMDYAFMTASAQYDRTILDEEGKSKPIDLQFESLVTALQFDITAGAIANIKDNVSGQNVSSYDIMSVSLISKTKNIYGNFTYDFDPEEGASKYKTAHTGTTMANRVIMHFEESHVSLTAPRTAGEAGEFLDVTFFILPEVIPAGDLQLQVLFKLGETQMSLTATINQELSPGKKYIFDDVKLKDFMEDVEAGSWFDTIDPNTLMSQLSIPVASNVFATSANGFAVKSVQQVLDYESLWNLGVRGFELVNRRTVTIRDLGILGKRYSTNNDWSLSGAHFVCDEVPHEDNNVTFGGAFETLAGKLESNPKEFLAVFCTYQAINDGYDPDGYVRQLLNYLDEFVASSNFTQDDFIQITSSTKVSDAQGKICIIIRPGDDDRYESNKYTSGISLTSKNGVDWSKNVLLIEDWGTAFDVWDRRYEGVARESTFETNYYHGMNRNPKLVQIEDWLWGVSSSDSQYLNYTNNGGSHNFNNGEDFPSKLSSFDYLHNIKGSTTQKAYIQEWARVANGEIYDYADKSSSSRYLWVKWPDSFIEKKEAIDGLFIKSVGELGKQNDNIYINSLSGYFIDKAVAVDGMIPFKDSFPRNLNTTTEFNVSNQGKGGNHVELAYQLNKYVYGILNGDMPMQNGSKLEPGPWGFVVMEHIGNTTVHSDDVSVKLVDLIMMNNFKLDLTTTTPSGGQGGGNTVPEGGSTTTSVKDYNSVYMDGENAISFE